MTQGRTGLETHANEAGDTPRDDLSGGAGSVTIRLPNQSATSETGNVASEGTVRVRVARLLRGVCEIVGGVWQQRMMIPLLLSPLSGPHPGLS